MSAKMKRRRRHDRLKRIRTEHRENMLFFTRGTFPSSAVAMAQCGCGSRAFSRDPNDTLTDWQEVHAHCSIDEDC